MPNEEAIQKMSIVDPIQVNVNIPNFEGKPGRDGTDGRDGDDAYRIAVRNGFLGTEKEWLLTLKGQDGKSASAPTARQTLLQNNVWCEDDTVDSVFTAIIGNWGKPMPRTEFKPLTLQTSMVVGLKDLTFNGEPHYKLQIDSKEPIEFDSDGDANVTIDNTNTGDSFTAYYLGYKNQHISHKLYTYGDLSQVFKPADLIESKVFEMSSVVSYNASVYNNNILSITANKAPSFHDIILPETLKPILDWAKTKIPTVETIIFDKTVTKDVYSIYSTPTWELIAKQLGYGFNFKADFSTLDLSTTDKERFLAYISKTSDTKVFIGKYVQIGTSNIFVVRDGMTDINYIPNTNTIEAE